MDLMRLHREMIEARASAANLRAALRQQPNNSDLRRQLAKCEHAASLAADAFMETRRQEIGRIARRRNAG